MAAASSYGTLTMKDLLASQQTVQEIGEENVLATVNAYVEAHNRMVMDMMSSLVEVTTDNLRKYGTGGDMEMDNVDELGRADAQKNVPGVNVGIPLYKFQGSLQWTREFFYNATGADIAIQTQNMAAADLRQIQKQVKLAIFTNTNSTVVDYLGRNQLDLPVKAFVNADSAAIPVGPNGETFTAASHTHYDGTASFVASDLSALITDVIEHYGSGQPMVYINKAQEATVRGFTGFYAALPPQVIAGTNVSIARGNLEAVNVNNRYIGIYDGAEIWVKPWIPANYAFAWLQGAPKPLLMREPDRGPRGLTIVADNELYPLRARTYERRFGVAVWNRTNGAVLRTNNATYAVPTITA